MQTGAGRLRDQQHKIDAGHGGDDRTADAGRSVHQQPVGPLLFCQFRSLPLHQTDQLARIFLADAEPGMHHRAIVRIGNKPDATHLVAQRDGPLRAEMGADAASFTGKGQQPRRILQNQCLEPAQRHTGAAAAAVRSVNFSLHSAPEFVFRLEARGQNKVQISGIHITVRHYLIGDQGGQGSGNGGFAGAALAAQQQDLFHDCSSSSNLTKGSRSSGQLATSGWPTA